MNVEAAKHLEIWTISNGPSMETKKFDSWTVGGVIYTPGISEATSLSQRSRNCYTKLSSPAISTEIEQRVRVLATDPDLSLCPPRKNLLITTRRKLLDESLFWDKPSWKHFVTGHILLSNMDQVCDRQQTVFHYLRN